MKANRISISFVGVFSKIQMMIPQLNSDFCQNIFEEPDSTLSALTPTGFVIKHREKVSPAIAITPQKVIVSAVDLDKLVRYVGKLQSELKKYEFAAYGLNQEIEWIDLDRSAKEWLLNQFIREDLKIENKPAVCGKLNLQYIINDKEQLFLDFEPRINVDNGIFGSINHHNQYPIFGFPNEKKLRELFMDSEKLVNSYLDALIH